MFYEGKCIVKGKSVKDINVSGNVMTITYIDGEVDVFNIGLDAPKIIQTVAPNEGDNKVALSLPVNLNLEHFVYYNGIRMLSGFNIVGNLVFFENIFTASPDAVFSDKISVEYYSA